MLLNLVITDLAVVKKLNLNLNIGMSVLTGETGAGKSILLTALGLALGDRADSDYVRPGAKRTEINLAFNLSDAPLAKQWLKQHDLDVDEQDCFIRRIVNHDGGSKAYINNHLVSLNSLKKLSALLVEIHGQQSHLTLLDKEQHGHLLDVFANNDKLLTQINELYQAWKQSNDKLNKLIIDNDNQAKNEEFLRYRLEELQQLELENYNYKELLKEHKKLANLDQILNEGQLQLDILYENEQQSAYQILSHSLIKLANLAHLSPEIEPINSLLTEAQIQLEEAAKQLRYYLQLQESDPNRLNWLENQIGIITDISRKHRVNPEQLPQLALDLTQQLGQIKQSSEHIKNLTHNTQQLLADYKKLSIQLSANRNKNGLILQEKISQIIKELGMSQGAFFIHITYDNKSVPKPYGNDTVEFFVSTNPGLPTKPLAKIASGGELSRISLAIQVASKTDKITPTMVFDEVDSGIGGSTAEIVGQKLRNLSADCQVLCVTHLPQVACKANQHLYVKKDQTHATSSTVSLLNTEERVIEIARMLGGIKITNNTIKHAKEMLGI